ncbi:MAG: AI-2E family transporter [Elusimicrobiales bacterium]|nr:AI-2E family transporter [Elusimicrobiales bacterium]
MEYNSLNRRFILNVIVSILILIIIYGFIKLISPFILAIFLGIIFSVVYYPVYSFFINKKINENISAFLSVIFMFVTIVVPFLLFGWLLFKEAKMIYPQTIDYLNNNIYKMKLNIPSFIPFSSLDIKEILVTNLEEFQRAILKSGGGIIKNIFFFFVNFFVMLISMFFLFKDGKKLLNWLIELVPLENKYIERILMQFSVTTNSIIKGVLLTAFVQGIVAALGYYIAGLNSPIMLGFLVIFSALIPFLGTSMVTIPVAIYCYLTKDFTTTIFIFIWGMFVVGLIDNFVRPIFIGKNAKLPIALVFLGIIGGLKTYGPIGIFLGPIFVSVIITLLEIYKEKINFNSKDRVKKQSL